MKLKPINDRVVVEPAPAEEMTEFLQKYSPRTWHERRKSNRAFAREA